MARLPPGWGVQGPVALIRWQESRARPDLAHPVRRAHVVQLSTDDLEVLEPMAAEPLGALDVAPVLAGIAMNRALVLPHDTGLRVEQVGNAEQVAVPVEDRHVAPWFGQPGVQGPAQTHPHLLRRPARPACEFGGSTAEHDPVARAHMVEEDPELFHGSQPRRDDHVDSHGGPTNIAEANDLVEQGTLPDRAAQPAMKIPLP